MGGCVGLVKPTSELLAGAEVFSEVCLLAPNFFLESWLAAALTDWQCCGLEPLHS